MKSRLISSAFLGTILATLMLASCGKQKSSDINQYEASIFSYLTEVHDIDTENIKDNIYYITPLSGCIPCVEKNLYNVSKILNPKVSVVFIDEVDDIGINKLYSQVMEQYTGLVYFDKHKKVYFYETGYAKPLLVHIKNRKIVYYLNIEDDLVPDALAYIREN
jgi:hypothetical protein